MIESMSVDAFRPGQWQHINITMTLARAGIWSWQLGSFNSLNWSWNFTMDLDMSRLNKSTVAGQFSSGRAGTRMQGQGPLQQ